jgi:hypothetical protein
MIQFIVDRFLDKITLHDLVNTEENSAAVFLKLLDEQAPSGNTVDITQQLSPSAS